MKITIKVHGEPGFTLIEAERAPERSDSICADVGVLYVVHRRWSSDLESVELRCQRLPKESSDG